ncbi:MAG: DUF167 domain-containing protein [bacterium]|nr:DUF167 domain-containing protein [bacterium]
MYIRVRVTAGAKKETFVQSAKDSFFVSVKEPALQNLANRRILELVALHFRIDSKQIRIISGHHSPGKILSIPGEDQYLNK